MVPGSGCIIWPIVCHFHRSITQNAHVCRRHQDHPIEIHPMWILQLRNQASNTGGTVAFANQILGGSPTILTCHKSIDPVSQILDVWIDPKKGAARRIFLYNSGIACIYRIDVHDVCYIQNGMRVGLGTIRLNRVTLVINIQYHRSCVGQVHPDGSWSRSTIETNDQGSFGTVYHIRTLVVGVK